MSNILLALVASLALSVLLISVSTASFIIAVSIVNYFILRPLQD